MTYDEYVAEVVASMGVNGTRRGIENLRTRAIRNSVIDLQRYIRGYRKGHADTYVEGDMTVDSSAHRFQMPDGCIPSAVYTRDLEADSKGIVDSECRRNRMDFVRWDQRQAMICGSLDNRTYVYAISPYGRTMMIFPQIVSLKTNLLLVWDGIKQVFGGTDVVPWPIGASEASAAYAQWMILKEVDKKAAEAALEYQNFARLRTALYRDSQETLSAEKPDEEYVS